jgi:hypothetical protein
MTDISDAEKESLRFHLGYGNLDYGAFPYTPDGFKELFEQVIQPNITGGTDTSATTAVTAGSTATVTPLSMTDITANARLVVDVGDDMEIVTVRAVTVSTFSAKFAKAHPSTGYPISTLSGQSRLRILLAQADTAWQAANGASLGAAAGLKSVDKGDVEWFEGFQVLKDRISHYKSIVMSISSLVRVLPRWADECSGSQLLEAY